MRVVKAAKLVFIYINSWALKYKYILKKKKTKAYMAYTIRKTRNWNKKC